MPICRNGRSPEVSAAGERIEAIRRAWGGRLVILGHHYQRASVLEHADHIGDSLELSRKAGSAKGAERIVFCGVRFMAESAVLLGGEGQSVYMPERTAGCPMANMADEDQLEQAWRDVTASGGKWAPVVYVNSAAEAKAFCGRHGGSACTSGNAKGVLEWAFGSGRKVLFAPDEHLGRNTAADLGVPDEDVALYDFRAPGGGLAPAELRAARLVVWKGFCLVHTAFTVAQIERVRREIPDAKIIVHPECPREVVSLADEHGSTAAIVKYCDAAPDGATVVVGTELNLIERLAKKHEGRIRIKALNPSVCANMAKTNEENLLSLLEQWPETCRVTVSGAVAADARLALERMLSL